MSRSVYLELRLHRRPNRRLNPRDPLQILSTFASLYKFHKKDYVYPNDRINDCWEKVLLNQCEFNTTRFNKGFS